MLIDRSVGPSEEKSSQVAQPNIFNAKFCGIRATSKRRLSPTYSKSVRNLLDQGHLNSSLMEHYAEAGKRESLIQVPKSWHTKKGIRKDCAELMVMVVEKWLNVLLLAAIPAVIVKATDQSDLMIFTWNFLVMLPLASILGDLTEVVAAHLGESIGGIMNATFGNAVELIVVIIAIQGGHIRVVQASLMGSIFSNILLVLGCAMLAAGRKQGSKEVKFNALGASVPACMLLVSAFILMVTSIQTFLNPIEGVNSEEVKISSRVGSIILMAIYVAYLVFSLKTHSEYFVAEDEEENEEELSLIGAIIALAVVTVLVSIFSDFLVGAINGVCASTGMTSTFLGVVLLPIIGNAVEQWTAVICAYKGKMNLAISISLGSAAQISLFVLPLAVLVGWMVDRDVTTGYPLYEVALFLFSIIIVSFLIQQGKANWMYGLMLLCIYGFIALAFWYEEVKGDE